MNNESNKTLVAELVAASFVLATSSLSLANDLKVGILIDSKASVSALSLGDIVNSDGKIKKINELLKTIKINSKMSRGTESEWMKE